MNHSPFNRFTRARLYAYVYDRRTSVAPLVVPRTTGNVVDTSIPTLLPRLPLAPRCNQRPLFARCSLVEKVKVRGIRWAARVSRRRNFGNGGRGSLSREMQTGGIACRMARRWPCDAVARCVTCEMEHGPSVIICILSPIVDVGTINGTSAKRGPVHASMRQRRLRCALRACARLPLLHG